MSGFSRTVSSGRAPKPRRRKAASANQARRRGQLHLSPLRTPFTLRPPRGIRFGEFAWDAPASDDVIADVAEFSRHNDARLFVVPRQSGVSRVSSGKLVFASSEWKWRIWSVTRDGELIFSEVRRFTH